MNWIVIGVCCGAVLFAIAVLGFCAYELGGKRARLARELAALDAFREPLGRVSAELATAQQRAVTAAEISRGRGRPRDAG